MPEQNLLQFLPLYSVQPSHTFQCYIGYDMDYFGQCFPTLVHITSARIQQEIVEKVNKNLKHREKSQVSVGILQTFILIRKQTLFYSIFGN
jgi:hypothetical protein